METKFYKVNDFNSGERIDKLLPSLNSDFSRTEVQELIKEGKVLVNGKTVKANYRTSLDDEIELRIMPEEVLELIAEEIPIDIVYEDEDIIVLDKEAGIVVHPSPGHLSGSLVNALLGHTNKLSNLNGDLRPGIVHRLDKDTSGLLMVAKTNQAHEDLVGQLVERTVERKYLALVHGVIPHDHGTIDAPIGRDERDRQAMTVTDRGKEAVTHFNVIERFKDYSLVECQLITGRTHQIRVHLKYIGYPLVGDPKYGPRKTVKMQGQALHAYKLAFIHPITKEKLQFTRDLPERISRIKNQLQK